MRTEQSVNGQGLVSSRGSDKAKIITNIQNQLHNNTRSCQVPIKKITMLARSIEEIVRYFLCKYSNQRLGLFLYWLFREVGVLKFMQDILLDSNKDIKWSISYCWKIYNRRHKNCIIDACCEIEEECTFASANASAV